MRDKGTPAELEHRRLLAVQRVLEGYSAEEVGDFLGVVVPAGRHTVSLDFSPPYFRAGGFVSIASLAAVVLLLATARPARRRNSTRRPRP